MAPIPSDDESSVSGSSHSDSGKEQIVRPNDADDTLLEDGGEKFHTEESDVSDDSADAEERDESGDEDDESEIDAEENASGVPLLPEHLLKHTAQAAPPKSLASVPWEQLTAKEKRNRRHNSRKQKKRQYDRLREDVKGTAVVRAGKVAQKKRGVFPLKKERVKTGRVEKKGAAKARMSGRQQMIEQRKRTAQMATAAGEAGGRKAKRSKR